MDSSQSLALCFSKVNQLKGRPATGFFNSIGTKQTDPDEKLSVSRSRYTNFERSLNLQGRQLNAGRAISHIDPLLWPNNKSG